MGWRLTPTSWFEERSLRLAVVTVIGIHLLTGFTHGGVHLLIPVVLIWWQMVIVIGSLIIGPLVGAVFVLTSRPRLGGAILAGSLTVAFGFELLAHFAVSNPDYVGQIDHGHVWFVTTAILSLLTDAIGVALGLQCWLGDGGLWRR